MISKNDFADKFIKDDKIIRYYLPLDEDDCANESVCIVFDDKDKSAKISVSDAYSHMCSGEISYDKMVEFCNKIINRIKT